MIEKIKSIFFKCAKKRGRFGDFPFLAQKLQKLLRENHLKRPVALQNEQIVFQNGLFNKNFEEIQTKHVCREKLRGLHKLIL